MEELIKVLDGIEYSIKTVHGNTSFIFKNLDEYKKAFGRFEDIHKLCSKYKWYRLKDEYSLVVRL